MLTMVCNKQSNIWGVHLSHLEYAYNNSYHAFPRPFVIDHTVSLIRASNTTSSPIVTAP